MNTWVCTWDETSAKSCWLRDKSVAFSVFVEVRHRVSTRCFVKLGLRCYLTQVGGSRVC